MCAIAGQFFEGPLGAWQSWQPCPSSSSFSSSPPCPHPPFPAKHNLHPRGAGLSPFDLIVVVRVFCILGLVSLAVMLGCPNALWTGPYGPGVQSEHFGNGRGRDQEQVSKSAGSQVCPPLLPLLQVCRLTQAAGLGWDQRGSVFRPSQTAQLNPVVRDGLYSEEWHALERPGQVSHQPGLCGHWGRGHSAWA